MWILYLSPIFYALVHLLFFLEVHQSAFDLFNRGGFTMKENILQKEIEKLLLEVERLKPSLGDKVERITTIISNIANIIKPF